MKRIGFTLLIGLTVCASVALGAQTATVGDLVVGIAEARGLPASSATVAAVALLDRGVAVPDDLDRSLTEGAAVQVLSSAGIAVRTSSPDRPMDGRAVSSLLSALSPELSAEPETTADGGAFPRPNGQAADPLTKGKGKKKGLVRSPSEPI